VSSGQRRCERCIGKRARCSFVPKVTPERGVEAVAEKSTAATIGQAKGKKRAAKAQPLVTTNAAAGPSNGIGFVGNPPPRVVNVGAERMEAFGNEAANTPGSNWLDTRINVLRRDILITGDQIQIQQDIKAVFESRLARLLEMKRNGL
jgi:hypothetical protein